MGSAKSAKATAPTVWFCLDCAGVADVDWSAPAPPGSCGRDDLTRSPRSIVARLRRIRGEVGRRVAIRDCLDAGLIDEGDAYRATTSRSVDRFGMSQRRRLRALAALQAAEESTRRALVEIGGVREALVGGNGRIDGSAMASARAAADGLVGVLSVASNCANLARAEMRRG